MRCFCEAISALLDFSIAASPASSSRRTTFTAAVDAVPKAPVVDLLSTSDGAITTWTLTVFFVHAGCSTEQLTEVSLAFKQIDLPT